MNTFKTYSVRKEDVHREWVVVDAADKVLGRLSSEVASKLRGKDRPDFTPHVDNGAFVVVINADKVRVTGTKLEDKKYYRHSGYPGGLKETSLKQLLRSKPDQAIYKAVRGMMPKSRLGRAQLKKLKVYAGGDHPHQAQQPTDLELS
ncbi:50S ribosomal protein L13 [Desulfovermiculus halophilus]|jgi:large subunit ribosomal protein L13|uniref:50S ribosomal protein L13 n=1 Tax=Desulfovermiculus halophilus TaxID=339722 RepID=UPI0004857DC6|nr:50S ribosomal protein L13 [Desulfovermiculus halophilus]